MTFYACFSIETNINEGGSEHTKICMSKSVDLDNVKKLRAVKNHVTPFSNSTVMSSLQLKYENFDIYLTVANPDPGVCPLEGCIMQHFTFC